MSNTTAKVRRARKPRRAECGGYHGHDIAAGELYIEHTEFPGGESGYADTAGHPVRMSECRSCAERYGRGGLFKAYDPWDK